MRHGRRRDRHVGKARMAANRDSAVGHCARDPAYPSIKRKYPLAGTVNQALQPFDKSLSTLKAAGAAQFADSLLDLCDRYGRNIEAVGLVAQPVRQAVVQARSAGRQD